jgi:hypothetical protein
MRKISTAARQQSRNLSQQTLTIGLDLGDAPATAASWMKECYKLNKTTGLLSGACPRVIRNAASPMTKKPNAMYSNGFMLAIQFGSKPELLKPILDHRC